jgi:hypothetical protein
MSLSTIVLAGHPIESLGERMVSPPPCVRLDFRVSTGAGREAELTAGFPFKARLRSGDAFHRTHDGTCGGPPLEGALRVL